MGDLQSQYSTFSKNMEDYIEFIDKDYQHKKIESIQEQIAKYKQLYGKLVGQSRISCSRN